MNPTDRPPGDRLPLQEVQKIALENRKDLTEEDERKLIEKLTTHRDTMRNGVRCNNIAANQDFQSTVERIGSEVRPVQIPVYPSLNTRSLQH